MERNYSNVAQATALAGAINASATSIAIGSNTGYPSVPYTIIIDPGLPTEEVCDVTAVAGVTWTVTRGVDGTSGISHDTGAVVVHGYSARDLRELQDHIGSETGIHGLYGGAEVVGTTTLQTLENKLLVDPIIAGGTLQSATLLAPKIESFAQATHTHEDADGGGTLGAAGTFYFPAAATAGVAYRTVGTAQTNVPGMSIQYTAPAVWPAGSTGIRYSFITHAGAGTGVGAAFNATSDGVKVADMNFDFFTILTGETGDTWSFSWIGPRTTPGAIHTARVVVAGHASGDCSLYERQFSLALV